MLVTGTSTLGPSCAALPRPVGESEIRNGAVRTAFPVPEWNVGIAGASLDWYTTVLAQSNGFVSHLHTYQNGPVLKGRPLT